jgi:cyanophycinase
MKRTAPLLLVPVACALMTGGAAAQAPVDSAAFIIRLGHDTVAVERWVRTADRLDAVAVTRSPRTTVRRLSVRLDDAGRVTHLTIGDGPERAITPAGAIPVVGGFYAPYALALTQAARSGAAESNVAMVVGSAARDFPVRRTGAGEFTIPNQFDVPMSARLGPDHRLLFIDAGGGSTVERVSWFDIDALGREFAARDERGAGLGPLSPRDTARAQVGGATILVDYSRPSARGRQIIGGLVPLDEVWRTGANDATRLVTDRAIRIGELRLEPGSYSLFTVPGRDRWQLIVNRRTGMSGLDRDPAQDVGTVPMQVRTLTDHVEQFTILVEPGAAGSGTLRIRWGTTEAFVPVTPTGGDAGGGRLVIVGGGLSRETESVYRAVLDARSGTGPLCIIPTAGAEPESSIASAKAGFERYGGDGVAEGLLIATANPEAARDATMTGRILGCSGFYFTGGVQSRIAGVFRPGGSSTPAYEALLRRHREGAVVAGSSAGAAIMSDPMISGGSTTAALARGVRRTAAETDDDDDETAGGVSIMTGLGFLPAIVDQHFLARGRIGRLITAVLELDEFDVGFGIDENTALVVEGSSVHPVGASGVVVVDARRAVRDGRSASAIDLHLLGAGDRYDLASGSVTPAAGKRPLASHPASVEVPDDIFARWALLHLLHDWARSGAAEVRLPFEGGELLLRRTPAFAALSSEGAGVQGAPAGLSITGVELHVRR